MELLAAPIAARQLATALSAWQAKSPLPKTVFRAISELGMFRRWLQSLALVLVAALVLNSQCYAACPVCTAPSSHASGCHHHPEKGNNFGKACPHQTSDLFSPEARLDLAKLADVHFAPTVGFLFVPQVHAVEIQPTAEILQTPEQHLPPGKSVLALLSTFRV